jgi:hypothetical protein
LNITENLNNSLEFSKKLFSDLRRLVILVVIDLIPLANWIVVGYGARVLRESPGGDAPPKLEKYGELFVDGAKIFFASLIYMIIPLILVAAGFGGVIASSDMTKGALLMGGTGLVLAITGVILIFVLLILLAAGIAHMIKTGKFSKAFAFSEILGIIRKIGWSKYIVWIILVGIIYMILGVVFAVPFIGWLIAAVVGPAISVFFSRSLGILYAEGTS